MSESEQTPSASAASDAATTAATSGQEANGALDERELETVAGGTVLVDMVIDYVQEKVREWTQPQV